MNIAEVLPVQTTECTHREWYVVQDAVKSNHYTLKTETGNQICTLIFPGNDTTFLNLIASAPELQDIAEMFRDSMLGKRTEKSMVFAIVREILGRLQ